jgi:dynein intermediate chain 1
MQNVHNDVLHGKYFLIEKIKEMTLFVVKIDFKYYDDASDEFRETGEGTILPLWKFAYDRAKKHHVTSISWSQTEPDMFAVSYGSCKYCIKLTIIFYLNLLKIKQSISCILFWMEWS